MSALGHGWDVCVVFPLVPSAHHSLSTLPWVYRAIPPQERLPCPKLAGLTWQQQQKQQKWPPSGKSGDPRAVQSEVGLQGEQDKE